MDRNKVGVIQKFRSIGKNLGVAKHEGLAEWNATLTVPNPRPFAVRSQSHRPIWAK